MRGERNISLNWRVIIAIIGTLSVLAVTMQTDNLNFAITLFLLLFVTVSVA